MDCKEFKNIVADLFDKEVSTETQKACNEHISHCAECRDYYGDLLATADLLRPKHSPISQKPITSNRNWMKIAASFIGILLITGMAFAAVHIISNQAKDKEAPVMDEKQTAVVQSTSDNTIETDTVSKASVVFDNTPLDSIVREIASYYHVAVDLQNEEIKQLRFYFVWKQEDSLHVVVEKLNMFESVNLTIEDKKLTVK